MPRESMSVVIHAPPRPAGLVPQQQQLAHAQAQYKQHLNQQQQHVSQQQQQHHAAAGSSGGGGGGRGGPGQSRMAWTPALHDMFVAAVEQLGGARQATPRDILTLMPVPGLSRDNVKSHLQKYRQSLMMAPAPAAMGGMRRPPAPLRPIPPRIITMRAPWQGQAGGALDPHVQLLQQQQREQQRSLAESRQAAQYQQQLQDQQAALQQLLEQWQHQQQQDQQQPDQQQQDQQREEARVVQQQQQLAMLSEGQQKQYAATALLQSLGLGALPTAAARALDLRSAQPQQEPAPHPAQEQWVPPGARAIADLVLALASEPANNQLPNLLAALLRASSTKEAAVGELLQMLVLLLGDGGESAAPAPVLAPVAAPAPADGEAALAVVLAKLLGGGAAPAPAAPAQPQQVGRNVLEALAAQTGLLARPMQQPPQHQQQPKRDWASVAAAAAQTAATDASTAKRQCLDLADVQGNSAQQALLQQLLRQHEQQQQQAPQVTAAAAPADAASTDDGVMALLMAAAVLEHGP